MSQTGYGFRYDQYGRTSGIMVHCRGNQVLRHNFLNKGTAFSEEERLALGLSGNLPPAVRSLAMQVEDCTRQVAARNDDLDKFVYIRSLFDRNATLAHALIASDLERYMRIIYTPTVGLACQQYSSLFRTANGLHFFPGNIDRAGEILRQYQHRDIRVAVVTDNQGILGLGDQGAGGIAICLGKLMLYSQGAGIAPWHCLPISLDVGTDNQALLADPFYLGWPHERLTGDDYLDFVGRFARAFKSVFPHALCQWEDFSRQNAFAIRDSYLHDLISFNDDIQGTGAVVMAGVLASMRAKGEKFGDQIFLIDGAGAGGVGAAEQLWLGLREAGLSDAQARQRIYTLDHQGLVLRDRSHAPYKDRFAREAGELDWLHGTTETSLLKVIRGSGATVLIGTSGQAGLFSREVVESMCANSRRPVIMPLSNPTANAEATPAEILAWSGGRALVATGSPFPPVTVAGQPVRIGQGNNVFVFPGMGLGLLASGAREVRPEFFTAAARAVAASVGETDLARGIIYPPVAELRQVSRRVAGAVGKCAIALGASRPSAFATFRHENREDLLDELLDGMGWRPEYLELIPA